MMFPGQYHGSEVSIAIRHSYDQQRAMLIFGYMPLRHFAHWLIGDIAFCSAREKDLCRGRQIDCILTNSGDSFLLRYGIETKLQGQADRIKGGLNSCRKQSAFRVIIWIGIESEGYFIILLIA